MIFLTAVAWDFLGALQNLATWLTAKDMSGLVLVER